MINFPCKQIAVIFSTVWITFFQASVFETLHCLAEPQTHERGGHCELPPGSWLEEPLPSLNSKLSQNTLKASQYLFKNIDRNPSIVQDIMAHALIKSATNLFRGPNECRLHSNNNGLEDSKNSLEVEDISPGEEHSAEAKKSVYTAELVNSLHSVTPEELHFHKPVMLFCRSRAKRKVECHFGPFEYRIVLPKDNMSGRSVRSLVRKISDKLHRDKRIFRRNVSFPAKKSPNVSKTPNNMNSGKCLQTNVEVQKMEDPSELKNNYNYHAGLSSNSKRSVNGMDDLTSFLQSIKSNDKNFSVNSKSEWNFNELNQKYAKEFGSNGDINRKSAGGPPGDLLLSDKDKENIRCKWLSKRQVRYPRYSPYYTCEETTKCPRNRCKKKFLTTHRPSVNDGKTARISFPLTHRCIINRCPCFVTTAALPPRTTNCVTEEELPPETSTVGRCQGMDLTPREGSSEEGMCSTSTGASCSCGSRNSKKKKKKTRSCGCNCECACSCHFALHRENLLVANNKAPCGCSCGCGCFHHRSADTEYHGDVLRSKLLKLT